MTIKSELLMDFAVNIPRVLVCETVMIIDYVKRIIVYSPERIVLYNGRRYTCIEGKNMTIKELKDERMMVTGEFEQFRFLGTLHENQNTGK